MGKALLRPFLLFVTLAAGTSVLVAVGSAISSARSVADTFLGLVVLDFGEWETDVASRKNADGTTSIVGISPGIDWVDFLVGEAEGKRTLTALDYQHEYVFVESGPQ